MHCIYYIELCYLLNLTFSFFSMALQNNFIITSKYTLLTFLPLNLLEQFQRLANFYFLCLLLLQLIPAISSLTPVTTALPLIGVLMLTASKDAYDDYVSIYADRWIVLTLYVDAMNDDYSIPFWGVIVHV